MEFKVITREMVLGDVLYETSDETVDAYKY